jgi:hypothetical protein
VVQLVLERSRRQRYGISSAQNYCSFLVWALLYAAVCAGRHELCMVSDMDLGVLAVPGGGFAGLLTG